MKAQRKILATAIALTLLIGCIGIPGIISNAAVVVNGAFDATQKVVIGNSQEGSDLWSYSKTSLNADCFGNTESNDAWAKAKFDFGTEGCNHVILGNGSNSEMHQFVYIDGEPVATLNVPSNGWTRGQSEADLAGTFKGVHEVKFQLDSGTNLYDVQFTKIDISQIAALDASQKVVIAKGNETAGYWRYANTAMNDDCFGNTDWGAWAMSYFDFGDGGYNRLTVGVGANDNMHAYMYVDGVFAATIAVPSNGWSRGETTVDLLMTLKGKHAIMFRLDGGTNLYDIQFGKTGAYEPVSADAPIDADTSDSSKWIWKSVNENGDEFGGLNGSEDSEARDVSCMSVGVDFGTDKNLSVITLLLAQPSVCIKMDVYVDTKYVGVIEQSETCDWNREAAKPGYLELEEALEGVHVITLQCVSGGGNLYQIAFSAPIAPIALGAKILKEPTATGDQNLRMDFDFSNTIANGADANIVEYGIILMGGTVSKADLTDASNTARQVISREVASAASIPSIVTVTITNSAENSGKRVSAVAYVKDSDGNYYYSSNSDERVNNGVVVKSVMGVMKAWYLDAELDKTNAIATYAAEVQLQAEDVEADLTKYATGEIGTADEKYEACKAALSGVFHHYYNG